ncbi:hypothetical protein QUF70_20165, partial [Desulfobacterales bacterium HSG17]|nr:hypothetical protein [Desulfobacterales bacterium HSG17]
NEFMKILDSDLDETQKIVDFILCHNRLSIENKEGYRLYFSGLRSADLLNMKIVQIIEQMRFDVRKKLTSVFKTGIQKGIFRDLNPELMTMTLKASLESLLNKLFEGCNDDDLRQFAEQLADLYLNGVLNQDKRRFHAEE